MPRLQEFLDSLDDKLIFPILHANWCYVQAGIYNTNWDKTLLIKPHGLERFAKMLFGLCNAPGTFQRTMSVILSGKMAVCLNFPPLCFNFLIKCCQTYCAFLFCNIALMWCWGHFKAQEVQILLQKHWLPSTCKTGRQITMIWSYWRRNLLL